MSTQPLAPRVRTFVAFHEAGPSGPSRSLEAPLRWLAEGGEVRLAVPGPGDVRDNFAAVGPVETLDFSRLALPRRPRDAGRAAAGLRREIRMFRGALRRADADLVVAVTTTLPPLLLAAHLEHVPALVYVGELHERRSAQTLLHLAAGVAVLQLSARLGTALLCCSHRVADQLSPRLRERAVIGYPPIDPAYGDGDGPAYRERHGLTSADPLLLAVGNVSRGRGQDVLIRALPEIRTEQPRARVVFAGGPHPVEADLAYHDECKRLAVELGVAEAVCFAGPVQQVADAYAAADILVNSARFGETFGRAACEALVAGVPVVSTDDGAIPEVLRDGCDALLVPPSDPARLAGAILELVGNRPLAARLVDSGRERVLFEFTEERATDDFAAAVRIALAR
jgi:glycosyltransferase involved in cell wall biosynthesis